MTLREAIKAGITSVRKPYWNPTARLELPQASPDGTHGPWCKIHDTCGSTDVLITQCGQHETDWEEFK